MISNHKNVLKTQKNALKSLMLNKNFNFSIRLTSC